MIRAKIHLVEWRHINILKLRGGWSAPQVCHDLNEPSAMSLSADAERASNF
jgi:hypothetical protein